MSKRVGVKAKAQLAGMVKRAGARAIFQIEGYADYRGDEAYNLELSQERADAVAAQLIRQGISASRIKRVHFGERGSSRGDELWRDRRVDIRILEGGVP
jgi:outer membrane protein OmpA-like peptidoglycan-associated protein